MSQINTNAILDASGGTTTSINGYTPTASNMAGRNRIINGDMRIAQRGTSVSGQTSSTYHTCDRWLSNPSGSTYNQSREIVPLGDSVVGQFKYFLRHETTISNNNSGLLYRIEDVQSFSEGALTLSFYAKGINPNNGTVTIQSRQRFGTGGTPSSDVLNFDSNITLTANWQRFTLQIDYPSLSGKVLGTNNDSYCQLAIRQSETDTSTDAWTIDITGVQLEEGSVATPFCPAGGGSYGQELALCQRYYWAGDESTYYSGRYSNGAFVNIDLPVTMRATPTGTYSSENSSGSLAVYHRTTRLAFYDNGDITWALWGPKADAEL